MHRKVLAKTDKRQLYRCATVAGLHKDYKHDGSTKKWYYQLKLNSFNKLLRFINEERKIQMKRKFFGRTFTLVAAIVLVFAFAGNALAGTDYGSWTSSTACMDLRLVTR